MPGNQYYDTTMTVWEARMTATRSLNSDKDG